MTKRFRKADEDDSDIFKCECGIGCEDRIHMKRDTSCMKKIENVI